MHFVGLALFTFAAGAGKPSASILSSRRPSPAPLLYTAPSTARPLQPSETAPSPKQHSERAPSPELLASTDDDVGVSVTRLMLPIWLAVLVQMLGVGITLSTLPLYMTSLGATPRQLATVVSVFSACQMVGGPALVALSARVGRLAVLRACLAGNACAALLTACASDWRHVAVARGLAGLTAASVPVAQVSVAEIAPPGAATSKALSRIASAASLGIIAGPAAGGAVAEFARSALGATSGIAESRYVFAAAGAFAAFVLVLTSGVRLPSMATARAERPEQGARDATAAGAAGAASSTLLVGERRCASSFAPMTARSPTSLSWPHCAGTRCLCVVGSLRCAALRL